MWHTHISTVLFVGVLRYDTMQILLCRKLTVSCGSPVRNLTFSDVPPGSHPCCGLGTHLASAGACPFCPHVLWPVLLGNFWDEVIAGLSYWRDVNSSSWAGSRAAPLSALTATLGEKSSRKQGRAEGAGARRLRARLLWCDHKSKQQRNQLVWGVFRKNTSLQSRILDRWSTRTYCMA